MPTEPPFENPPSASGPSEQAEMQYTPGSSTGPRSRAVQVLRKHEAELRQIDGVEGVGIGQNQIGDEAINVYIRDAGVKKRLPASLDGISVQAEITGIIDALPQK